MSRAIFCKLPSILFPAEADDLQKIHDDLAVALEACGIKELNMHVIQQNGT